MTRPKHVLNLTGQGHFSRGTCTGCEWAMKGHADEIERVWHVYHQGDEVKDIPTRVIIPKPTGDPAMDAIEHALIASVAMSITLNAMERRWFALGLAQARSALLGETDKQAHVHYVSDMTARIAHVSERQRAKLMSPTITRDQQQTILDIEMAGGSLSETTIDSPQQKSPPAPEGP